jgi:hypothetical protein
MKLVSAKGGADATLVEGKAEGENFDGMNGRGKAGFAQKAEEGGRGLTRRGGWILTE